MKLLFVHQNFPGQFMHLAPAMQRMGHDVRALTPTSNPYAGNLPTIRYEFTEQPVDPAVSRLGRTFTQMTDRATATARRAHALRASGFIPDVIYGHSGWGETLFLKEVWPEARLVIFAEFYRRGQGADVGFDPEFQAKGLALSMIAQSRAAHLGQALLHADLAVSPTEWQASTHPAVLRDRIKVIFDGVDCHRVAPNPFATFRLPNGRVLKPGDEVLTFINRNLEPYRGYHIFMRSLPAVLAARPGAQVVIVGGDGVSYGQPPASGSWKDIFLNEVRDRIDLSRVHFIGRLPHGRLIDLMHIARVHAYLTYPFVLSWSMVEALAAGVLVVGSNTPPVAEVIKDGVNGRLVDFFDIPGWSETLIDALARPLDHLEMRRNAQRLAQERYDLRSVCLPQQVALLNSLAAG